MDVQDTGTGKDTKVKGYQTVRYTFSGLVSAHFADQTKVHNESPDKKAPEEVTKLLNENIIRWIYLQRFQSHERRWITPGEVEKCVKCLVAPIYTVFSNTISAVRYHEDKLGQSTVPPAVPIEQPHNALHLAVGGFDVPGDGDYNVYEFANGDMGENDTSAFDPLFFPVFY